MSLFEIKVTCSKCWNDVLLKWRDDIKQYSGECSHCMVTLDGEIIEK